MTDFSELVRLEATATKMGGPRGCFVGAITLKDDTIFERTYLTADLQSDERLNEGTDIGTAINVVDEIQSAFAHALGWALRS